MPYSVSRPTIQSVAFTALISSLVFCTRVIAAEWTSPLTEHGHPDLQGVWYFGSETPFQRPSDLGETATYDREKVRAIENEKQQQNIAADAALDPDRSAPEAGVYIGFEADFNFANKRNKLTPVNGEYRTSLIVDPPNGQIPAREDFKDFHAKRKAMGIDNYDGPEAQDASERCLVGGLPIPSLYPMPWNANLQIVQNEHYIVLLTEMIHDARIVKLNKEHAKQDQNTWMGDSIGYWDEDTLVVHTINFRPEHSAFLLRMSEDLQTTERFTPLNSTEILYSVELNDPQALSQSFTVERIIQRRPASEPIYEFACHEGNYSMSGVLAGARMEERIASAEKSE